MTHDRMDTGRFYTPLADEVSKMPPISSASDLNEVIDLYVAREAAWHTGSHPIQTFLSCLYVEDMLTSICCMSRDPQGSLFAAALKQELLSRAITASTTTNTTTPSTLLPEEKQTNVLPKIVAPISQFVNTPERIPNYKNELESFFGTASTYYLLALAYFLGAIKTADLCLDQYSRAATFVYGEEDIGLTIFDLTLFHNTEPAEVMGVLAAAQTLLANEQKIALEKEEFELINSDVTPVKKQAPKPKSKGKGGKGSKGNKQQQQPQQQSQTKSTKINFSTTSTDIKNTSSRFTLCATFLQILTYLPQLESEATFTQGLSTVDEILLSLPSSKKKSKFEKIFSKGMQSRCNNFNPVRELSSLSVQDGYTTFKSILKTISSFRPLLDMARGAPNAAPKTSGSLRSFFVAFGSSKPTLPISSGVDAGKPTQSLPIARAALHNLTLDLDKSEILGEPVLEWVLRDMKEISCAPYMRVLLNNSIMRSSDSPIEIGGLDALDELRPNIDLFLENAQYCYVQLLYAFVCNRARQRQMLSHAIILWDSLEVAGQELENAVTPMLVDIGEPLEQYTVQNGETNESGMSTQRAFPLIFWAGIRRMLIIEWVILMGFELDIYRPWEYAFMYDYAEEVTLALLGYLNESVSYVSDAKEFRKLAVLGSQNSRKPLYKGDPASFYADADGALAYIQGLIYEQEIIKELCASQRRLVEAGVLLGYVPLPVSSKFTTLQLQYGLRMKPFSSIGYPAPPDLDFSRAATEPFRAAPDEQIPGKDMPATPTRVNKRLMYAKLKGSQLQRTLGEMLRPLLQQQQQQQHKHSSSSSQSGLASSAVADLSNLRNSAGKIAAGAEQLEKHLKSSGGFSGRKKYNVSVSFEDCNPWFPGLVFERV